MAGGKHLCPSERAQTIRVREVDPRQSSNKTQSGFNILVSAYLHLNITTKTTLGTIASICGHKPSREEAGLWMAYVRWGLMGEVTVCPCFRSYIVHGCHHVLFTVILWWWLCLVQMLSGVPTHKQTMIRLTNDVSHIMSVSSRNELYTLVLTTSLFWISVFPIRCLYQKDK